MDKNKASASTDAKEYLSVKQYVPHRGTMLLLDKLLEVDEEHAVAQVRIPMDGVFNQSSGVPGWVAIEYMAQTVAAWAGWCAHQKQQPVKLGFLLGSRKFEVWEQFFAPASVLTVHVHCELMGSNGLGMFDCKVIHGGKLVAAAKVSVFEPLDGKAYLSELEEKKDRNESE